MIDHTGESLLADEMVKVGNLSGSGVEICTVNRSRAQALVEEAHAQGKIVINTATGLMIDKLAPGVNEIMLVPIIDGG